VTSAQAVFSSYCALRGGPAAASATPTQPSGLAGDVTYYITDLPDWSSLAPCAATAVSRWVQTQTYQECQSAPLSLVSCVCVKDQNSEAISGYITSEVRQNCAAGGPATADITSAIGVLDEYCSAGKGLVTPTGVTISSKSSVFFGTLRISAVLELCPIKGTLNLCTDPKISGADTGPTPITTPVPDSLNSLFSSLGARIGMGIGGFFGFCILVCCVLACFRSTPNQNRSRVEYLGTSTVNIYGVRDY
jgi:hypothetical protein